MDQYISKDALVAEIERIKEDAGSGLDAYGMGEENGKLEVCDKLLSFIDSLKTKDVDFQNERKEDKEMPTSGECVTLSKERYQELLEYESVALWAFNVIIVESLPSIEDEKLKEISDDAKRKAVQAAFQEALKNKDDKK